LVIGGWYIFLDHPFGVGTGAFQRVWAGLGYLEDLQGYARGKESAAHSEWIKILVENGIPGGLLLSSFVLSFTVTGWRRHDRNLLTLGLLVTATLAIAFISTEIQWGKGLWFLAAGVTALLNRQEIAGHLRGAAQRQPIYNIIRPGGPDHG
jgi:O-antigen ligase